MTVKEIVEQYLINNGFDGLYQEMDDCGCTLEDLMPCGDCPDSCEPGSIVGFDENKHPLVGRKQ